jgi:hypothetical protein
MSFSGRRGLTCIYLSILNAKIGAKIEYLKAFFSIFGFHGL